MVAQKGQRKAVLDYFKEHKGLTSIQAFELFGATRLASIVHDLRRAGYDIRNVWVESTNRYGEDVRYVRYIYKGEVNEVTGN